MELADVLALGVLHDRCVRPEDALQPMAADLANGHKRTGDVQDLEDRHEQVLPAAPFNLKVDVHVASVRDAVAVAHHKVLLWLAAGALEDAVSWRLGCVHHVVYASRIQRDLDFNVFPLAQEDLVVLAVIGDDQGVFLSAAKPLEVLVDLGCNLQKSFQT